MVALSENFSSRDEAFRFKRLRFGSNLKFVCVVNVIPRRMSRVQTSARLLRPQSAHTRIHAHTHTHALTHTSIRTHIHIATPIAQGISIKNALRRY